MKTTAFFLILFGSVSYVSADETFFYKYAENDGKYVSVVSSASQALNDRRPSNLIAKRWIGAKFDLKGIPKSFYKIREVKGIIILGKSVTQYSITPINNDRFSHVVWVDESGNLVKSEIFDTDNRLMFSIGSFDIDNDTKIQNEENILHPLKNTFFYKGFSHVFTKVMPDGVLHLAFMDGINKFSVFINPFADKMPEAQKIIFGNYLLSKMVDDIEYTVVGSLPYDEMQKIIDILASSKQSVISAVKQGQTITDAIYK